MTKIAPNTTTTQINDYLYLTFYESTIAKKNIHSNEITLGPDWNYSRITANRLRDFLGQSSTITKQQVTEGIIPINKRLGDEIT